MDSIEKLLNKLTASHESFRNHKIVSFKAESEQRMGFSGACVCEIHCVWAPVGPPARLFMKHVVHAKARDAATDADARAKAIRNRQSYWNEVAALSDSYFCAGQLPSVLRLPTIYLKTHSHDFTKPSPDEEESWTFLYGSLNASCQQLPVFERMEQLHAVLQWLATAHAFHWGQLGPSSTSTHAAEQGEGQEQEHNPHAVTAQGVWEQGTHLAYHKRPTEELAAVGAVWADFTAPTAFNWPQLSGLGVRLSAVAQSVGAALSVHAPRNQRRGCVTLVHGDVKPGNIFLEREREAGESGSGSGSSGSGSSGSGGVTMIDFQWSGLGLAATDVAYFLAMAPSDALLDLLSQEGGGRLEVDYLCVYYNYLQAAHAKFHGDSSSSSSSIDGNSSNSTLSCSYPYEAFREDFQLALLDFMRWMVPARMRGERPAAYKKRQECPTWDLNMGAYRRSAVMMQFLMERVGDYLPVAEALAAASKE